MKQVLFTHCVGTMKEKPRVGLLAAWFVWGIVGCSLTVAGPEFSKLLLCAGELEARGSCVGRCVGKLNCDRCAEKTELR